MQQDMRAAMYMMTREIRGAGYNPNGSTDEPFLIASTAEVQFQLVVGDPNEQVRYVLSNDDNADGFPDCVADVTPCVADCVVDGTPCILVRQEGVDLEQVVALNVDALNIVYFDADGTDLVDPGTGSVPADDIRDIRSVQITIVGRSGARVPVIFNSGTDSTSYTNQQGTEILGAQNDEFRRIRLTSEVKVRNMGL
jgi:type IV pilus assembly protein PilW